ncbi:hypothetical protein FE296_15825 [Paenibacillus sp. UASWS1643]|nr:hypothetical protein FE296_15825 [Paenibacillus sp. UASWS1643]
MRVNCKCGKKGAEYAVYESAQPHCLRCMLVAVNCTIAIPVRRLDPWEMERPEDTKKAAH